VAGSQSGRGQMNLTQNLCSLNPKVEHNIDTHYESLKYQMTIFDIRFLIQAK